jgi:ribosomal-protein-alanine N-acetyltransferase
MLEGKKVNLRVMEKDDADFLAGSINSIDLHNEFLPISQTSKTEVLKRFDSPPEVAAVCERQRFIIEKKDGTKVGIIAHWLVQPTRLMEIGYDIVAPERGKGYGTEAVQLIVDYLFLSKDIERVQANTDVRNKPSQRVLEKAGFKREGLMRRRGFIRGLWTDAHIYSIIRSDWREPKALIGKKSTQA